MQLFRAGRCPPSGLPWPFSSGLPLGACTHRGGGARYPAPDARDRLRKIFTILAKHMPGTGVPALEDDSASEDDSEVEG